MSSPAPGPGAQDRATGSPGPDGESSAGGGAPAQASPTRGADAPTVGPRTGDASGAAVAGARGSVPSSHDGTSAPPLPAGPWRSLMASLGMFTILPVPPTIGLDERLRRRTMLAMPWAGLVCGLLSAAAAALVLLCRAGNLLAAMAGLAVLAGATGAMHLDGVGDTADGLASRKGPEDALALMKKSDIGPMGVATIVLVLLLQACGLASTALGGARLVACLAVLPVVGRISAVLATVTGNPGARSTGFGALFTGITRRRDAVLDALAVLVVCVVAGRLALGPLGDESPNPGKGPVLLLACWPLAALLSWLVASRWQRHLLRRLGGLTGDTFGSLVEVTQTCFVILVALGLGALS